MSHLAFAFASELFQFEHMSPFAIPIVAIVSTMIMIIIVVTVVQITKQRLQEMEHTLQLRRMEHERRMKELELELARINAANAGVNRS